MAQDLIEKLERTTLSLVIQEDLVVKKSVISNDKQATGMVLSGGFGNVYFEFPFILNVKAGDRVKFKNGLEREKYIGPSSYESVRIYREEELLFEIDARSVRRLYELRNVRREVEEKYNTSKKSSLVA